MENIMAEVRLLAQPNQAGQILVVGNKIIGGEVQKALEIPLKLLQVRVEAPDDSRDSIHWHRDYRVVLLDGTHLIPYLIKDSQSHRLFTSLFPPSSKIFLRRIRSAIGVGTTEESISYTQQFTEKNQVAYKKSQVALEGGNCHLFINSRGEKKAIVGVHSVILSLIALEEQGFFKQQETIVKLKKLKRENQPTEESLFMARNLAYYTTSRKPLYDALSDFREKAKHSVSYDYKKELEVRRKLQELGGEEGFAAFLEAQLSEKERSDELLTKNALELEAKLELVKEVIAEEIGVLRQHCAFINQTRFHIDLESFVDPNGDIVYLHDDQISEKCLSDQNLVHVSPEYLENAKKNVKRGFHNISAQAAKDIEKIGCRVSRVAGVFEAKEGNLNFMNGIVIKSFPFFITNGTTDSKLKLLQNLFHDSITATNPNFKLMYIYSRILENILDNKSGGLRCMTSEIVSNIKKPESAENKYNQ